MRRRRAAPITHSHPQQSHAQTSAAAGGSSRTLAASPRPPHAHNGWVSTGICSVADPASLVSADELAGAPPLPGELPTISDIKAYVRWVDGVRCQGFLSATSYALRFAPAGRLPPQMAHLPASFFSLPMACVRRIERPRVREGAPPPHLDIICKDGRVFALGFDDSPSASASATAEKIVKNVRARENTTRPQLNARPRAHPSPRAHPQILSFAFPPEAKYLHAFASTAPAGRGKAEAEGVPATLRQPGWDVYEPTAEFRRIGLFSVLHPTTGEPLYRITEANRDFSFIPTYPAFLATVARATDAHLATIAGFRSKGRLPALTWIHPANKTTLWRCSQPKVGLGGNACAQDELLLLWIREANIFSREGPAAPLLVADCRPQENATGNLVMGGGYESYAGTKLEFCNIHNIHVVRDSYKKVEALCLSTAHPNSKEDINWSAALTATGWLTQIRTVLAAGLLAAKSMHHFSRPVLVHCASRRAAQRARAARAYGARADA